MKLLLAILATLSLSSGAYAQTLPTKAPPKAQPVAAVVVPCTVSYCVAPYVGLALGESGGSFNIVSTGVNGLANNNLNLGGEAGFDFWNGSVFMGVNVLAEYGLSQNGVIPGGGTSRLWGTGAWAKLGYNVASALGINVNTSSTPTLAGIVASTVPYVNIGIWDRPWGAGFLSGVGVQGWIGQNWTIHVDYNHVDFNNAMVNSNVKQQTEDMVLGGVDYHFSL